jgi:hypothetical protein
LRTVAWFSCGATSAIACKIALESDPNAVIAYCDTGSEHSDNARFLRDCGQWFGREITVLRSPKYRNIWDVFEKTRYLVGVGGARCTTELKKKVRQAFSEPDDLHVMGFDAAEEDRAARFRTNNPELRTWFPLLERGIRKGDCLDLLRGAGIDLPAMYLLGYQNNNCIGCVKGQAGYWNKIRRDFPHVFARMAQVERELDAAICKTYVNGERMRVFLDELPEEMGSHEDLPVDCSLFCAEGEPLRR